MIVAVPNTTSTQVLAAIQTNVKYHAVWFQNFDETAGFYLNSQNSADDEEFYLAPAMDATHPSSLVIQSSGGDQTLVNQAWNAYQDSGGALNLSCGRW